MSPLVGEGDADGRIVKYCPPPLLALAQGFFGVLAVVDVRQKVVPTDDAAFPVPERMAARLEPPIRAVGAPETVLEIVRSPGFH
jgi:hypothetical protein